MKKNKNIIAIMLIITMACMLTACSTGSPEYKAQKYLNALVAGDVKTLEKCQMPLSEAYSSTFKNISKGITNTLFNTALDDSGMNAIAGSFLAYSFSGYEFKVTGSEINGESANVYFDVYKDGSLSSSNEYLPLTKYNGEWYVTLTGYLN